MKLSLNLTYLGCPPTKSDKIIEPLTTLTTILFEEFPRRTHWLTVKDPSLPEDLSILDILFEIPSSYPQRDLIIPLALVNHSDKPIKLVRGRVMATMEKETGRVREENTLDPPEKTINSVEQPSPDQAGEEEKGLKKSQNRRGNNTCTWER